MLFGGERLEKGILQDAMQYAEQIEAKLVYASMIGSVSKGINRCDSDYDIRFLFLRKDFPNKICIPGQMQEHELIFRYFPKDKIWESMPFWELTAFFQFLLEPGFGGAEKDPAGLYNVVVWTMGGNYTWDPYGLQMKILPLMNFVFKREWVMSYHFNLLKKYEIHAEEVVSMNYLYCIHAAATIEWCMKYNTVPPVNLRTLLLSLEHRDIWKTTSAILKECRLKARAEFQHDYSLLSGSHYKYTTERIPAIETYVDGMVEKYLTGKYINELRADDPKKVVDDIYDIVYEAVFEEEPLLCI